MQSDLAGPGASDSVGNGSDGFELRSAPIAPRSLVVIARSFDAVAPSSCVTAACFVLRGQCFDGRAACFVLRGQCFGAIAQPKRSLTHTIAAIAQSFGSSMQPFSVIERSRLCTAHTFIYSIHNFAVIQET